MNDRRSFLKSASAGLLSAAAYQNILGSNDRVRAGFIGIGLIGKRHLLDFLAQEDVEVAAICEVYDPRLREGIATVAEKSGKKSEGFKDFRRMFDRKDIDVVVISTPDHWHALMTILACAAGKDVYVEKPLTLFAREGRWMIDAARHYKRVVQVGTQQRSGEQYKQCVELIRNGQLGEIRNIRMASFRNIMPGFTKPVGVESLSEEDWRMWVGPAPYRPFDKDRCIYHFRWFWDYSGGQTTNLLSHNIDIVQWAMNAMPRAVAAMGGRYSLKGLGETPDVFESIFDYPGFIVNWSCNEISANRRPGLEFCGTKGTLRLDRGGFEIIPDPLIPAENQIPSFTEPRRVSAPPELRTAAVKKDGYEQVRDQFQPHVRNFLDCVKSRQQPASDLESGHKTSMACHLANIALKVGRTVRWDDAKEEITGDRDASKLLVKEYRAPWDRELKAVMPRT
ncbi:MAG: Gfo/Idh/MocA family oxidoreductase [Acidobacteria bacterium]|nr:Gfo/Idh/MocA family oxidoreductase [Acidobacteriota bacterium]